MAYEVSSRFAIQRGRLGPHSDLPRGSHECVRRPIAAAGSLFADGWRL